MKFNNLICNFSAGEWSPKMRARSDAKEYGNACETLKNFIPKVQGGAFRRPPTNRVILDAVIPDYEADLQGAFSNTLVKSKMIPRILGNGAREMLIALDTLPSTTWIVIDAGNPTNPNVASPVGAVHTNADFLSGAASLKYTQVGDLVFITNYSTGVGVPPRVWYPSSLTGGEIDAILSYNDHFTEEWKLMPYRPIVANGVSVTLTPSATTGAITLDASAAFFNSGHVGTFFKLSSGGTTGAVKITGYNSSTQVTATVLSTVAATAHGAAATTSWEEGAWSDYRGWPRTVTSYQGRVIYGGNKDNPEALWGSRIGNVFDFMERPFEQGTDFTGYTSDNSRPFTLTPAVGPAGVIRALSAGKTLAVFTDRNEIVGSGTQSALGPNDVSFESSTSFGANTPMPARANNYLVFVQKGGRKLRDIIFNFQEDQYKSNDLTFVADHMTIDDEADPASPIDSIVEIHGSESDSSYIWAKTQNGRLLCVTLDRDYQINAWSRVVLGGKSELKTYPLVKSVCAIESGTAVGDRVFMIVVRRINGQNKVFLEYFDTPQEVSSVVDNSGNIVNAAVHVDLKKRFTSGSPTSTITGADYLKGETVQVIADGQYVGDKVVDSSGNITLDGTCKDAIYGLGYESLLKQMPIEIGGMLPNSPQVQLRRLEEISVKFYMSYGAQYGTVDNKLYDMDFKNPLAAMNAAPKLFTGLQHLKAPAITDHEAQPIVRQIRPWPCNIVAIVAKGQVYD